MPDKRSPHRFLLRTRLAASLALALLALPTLSQAVPEPTILLRGRVTSGVKLYGEQSSTAHPQLQSWQLRSTAHPHPGAATAARIVELASPSMRNAQGKPRVDGPGDTVQFEATVKWSETGAPPFGVALHTNANNPGLPDAFNTYSMQLAGRQGDTLRYVADIPIFSAGTYKAKAVVVKDSHALSWSPGGNFVFRPYFREHDRISEKLVHVANLGTGRYGTFEDMIGREHVPNPRGKYTVSWMKHQGATAVRLLPFKPHAGSPYSATSFFDVCSEHSVPARQIQGQIDAFKRQHPQPDAGGRAHLAALERNKYKAAIGSLRSFIDAAHKQGLRVYVDYIANHTGPDVRLLDVFFADQQGRSMDVFDFSRTASQFEVRLNDTSGLASDAACLAQMNQRLDETERRRQLSSLQKVASHLYGKWGDTRGAQNEQEIADGGWFEWPKPGTWQLNHGCQRQGYRWYDLAQTPQTSATRRLVLRDMAFLVLLGVDGFRLDHLTGMPQIFMEKDLNLLQGLANKYRPGVNLFYNGEDFHRGNLSEARMDALERGGFRMLLGAQGPDQFRAAVDAGWRQASLLDVGNHDEGGAIHKLGGNTLALARVLALNAGLGGPSGSKMLDEFAEARPVDHHNLQHKPWGLFHTTNDMRWVAQVERQASQAKQSLPALWERQRDWMQETSGKWHPDLLVAARYRDRNDKQLALVAANFHGLSAQSGSFRLTPGASARLKDGALYQIYNQMEDADRPLWREPQPGWKLKQQGLYLSLRPNEAQILDVREVRISGGGYQPLPRSTSSWQTIGYSLDF